MLDVGWSEILVIAIVLIIVVGPKELPQMLRTFGRMMTKMRGMAGEFRQQFDEAIREADLEDVKKTIGDAQKLNPLNTIRDAVNPLKQMGNEIKADLQKSANSASTSNPVVGNPTVGSVASAATTAVPGEPPKAASAEPVAAEPLKKGPTRKTTKKTAEADAAKPAKKASVAKAAPAKTPAASRAAAKSVAKPATKTATKAKPRKTKKDEA